MTGKTKDQKPIGKIKKLFTDHKKIAIPVLIVFILLLAFAAYRVWLSIHFLITDDILVNLEPQEKSLSVHYGEKSNVTFSVAVENSFFCDAYCSYEFRDLSTESVIDNGYFSGSGIGKGFEKAYNISAERSGSGQNLYSFDVQCNNIRTWHCLTNENKRTRSSFLVLNYKISDYEQYLKETLKDNITRLVNELSLADISLQQVNNRFFELGFNVNFRDLEGDKEILNTNQSQIVLEFKNLERLWSEENYLLVYQLFNKSYDKRIGKIKEQIAGINSKIDGVLLKHNSIIQYLIDLDNKLRSQNETISFLGSAQNPIILQHNQLLNFTEKLKSDLIHNSFANYASIENDISYLKLLDNNFENALIKNFAYSYVEGSYHYSLERERLCRIKGICPNETDFLKVIRDSLSVDYGKVRNICSSFDSINDIYSSEKNKSEERIKSYNLDEVMPILENVENQLTSTARKNIFEKIKSISLGNASNASLGILNDVSYIDENLTTINYGNLTEPEALSLIKLNFTNDSMIYYNYNCNIADFNLLSHYGNKTEIFLVENIQDKNFTSRIGIQLTPNYPVCCIFGECKRCCTQDECKSDPALYPILILHGHAFNRDNSPEFSLDAFNKIQSRLQQDGYISAGTITPRSDYSEIKEGEWGLSSRPVSVKGSYYLVSYYNLGGYSIATQKSENIETYAIRLKELIDLLKFRTGKDKVIIIAHSMGGLVARSYINIFGEASVDKLILISTPNKGISGKVTSYCPILGEKKECSDMSAESIFIKKLNDPSKMPTNLKVYNIVGTGCDIDGKPGDGIVAKENAELDFAENFYVNGTCTRVNLLHTNILDINIYPELYETLKSVLKQ